MRGSKRPKKSEMPVRHGYYAASLAFLTLASTFLIIPIVWLLSFYNIGLGTGYGILVIYALILSYLFSEAIKEIYHREKKEMLTGILLSLPSSLLLTFFLELSYSIGIPVSINVPIIAGLAYFVAFNARFVIEYYEHRKHRHYLGLYFVVPVLLVTVALLADDFAASMPDAADLQVEQSFEEKPSAMVKQYVESCVTQLTADITAKKTPYILAPEELRFFEQESAGYIDSNLRPCIDMAALQKTGIMVEFGEPTSEVDVHQSDISINVYMDTKIIKGNTITQIDRYFIKAK